MQKAINENQDTVTFFSHEKLEVYKKAIEFVTWVTGIIEKNGIKGSIADQLDRASYSIVINIAEGNGRYTGSDRCRFYDISRGSAFESAGCLDVLVAKKKIEALSVKPGKILLHDIVAMLFGLIKSNSDRVFEENLKYEN
jgi:four helix bundle protein